MSATLKNTVFNLINHKETNVLVTALLLFISIYIALLSILDRNIVDPLRLPLPTLPSTNLTSFNETMIRPERVGPPDFSPNIYGHVASQSSNLSSDNFTFIIEPIGAPPKPQQEVIRDVVDQQTTILSLFFLWAIALFFGRIVSYFYLPPLLGMLLAGIMIRNIDVFAAFWQIDSNWDQVLRQFAFILILIRCGVNLEPEPLRRSLGIFTSLGFLSTTVEATAICLTAHFLFQIPVVISILFAYILSATSPAVTIPTIIRLQEKGYGTDKGIPTTILASVSIDNIYCITAFTIVGSVVFGVNGKKLIEILVGALVGILIGLLLRIFPRSDVDQVHFVRSVFICSCSVAVLFGTDAIGCYMAGPVSVLLLCVVSSMRWKVDNHHSTRKEEYCYRILWDALLQPFLFALIGLLFDFSQMSWEILWNALAIIFIGVCVRFIFILFMTFFMRFEAKEKLFVSLCFVPKATVQAALAPLIFQYQTTDSTSQHMQMIFQTCVLSILITAPIGQLIIELLGKVLLNKHIELAKRNLDPLPLPTLPPPSYKMDKMDSEPNFLISDADNRLRLKVNGKPTKEPSKFEEINQQAFEIFKEQRIGKKPNKPMVIDEITQVRKLPDVKEEKPTKF
ncbi:hypothetical protein M3Y97_00951400 [Aphelenchoides bicaudatus]|nr:hypothetical protein M3Y97_00951400 [Aphelenchoides bicaudatus]